jgi:hypothetical protein
MDHDEAIEGLFAERYFLQELAADEREDYEAHFFGCKECARQVQALSDSIEHVKEMFAAQALGALGVQLICPGHPQFERAVTELITDNAMSDFVAATKGISVVLRNDSRRAIVGYSVNWKYEVGGSTTVRGVTYWDLESLLDDCRVDQSTATDCKRSVSVAPGSARLVSLIGNVGRTESHPSPGWKYENVHEIEALIHNVVVTVALDGVMFDDGEFIGSDRNRLFEGAIASFDGLQDLYRTIGEMSGKSSEADLLLWVERQPVSGQDAGQWTPFSPHEDRVRFERSRATQEFLRLSGEHGLAAGLEWTRSKLYRKRPDFRVLNSEEPDYNIQIQAEQTAE